MGVEYIDVVNEDGSPAGYSLPRSEIHAKGLWHRVVHVWLIDDKGNLLIQQRADNKESHPSLWDISTAGHCEAGMNSRDTAVKELSEELGMQLASADELEYLFTCRTNHVLKNGLYIDNELADVYLLRVASPIDLTRFKLQVEEVQAIKLIHHSQLRVLAEAHDPTFVPLAGDYVQFFNILATRYP
ncbi:hypothetical protein SAMD00019534_033940 [Acytostelium subglobosum LB1]|uniref:hypothetical protein n=1 Tax=Acytostelium subglobosum LB1 TaxID=1410327 RepID=UPI0006447E0C|nr:hypothetical protein SAMD00019534_033940 [Acytostelium subglobosum LB1]GAM20219.1 hypothetical protein SAMD00019534_033940 [Acytostelium subglobosum LB1]|eukprot:XP_012759740.1 hypothetical protein SAMD00019534_033940 [Acytostelium subglobosum LB1]